MDPQQVINESRPMLEEFLAKLGIFRPGQRICDARLLDELSDWIDRQHVRSDDEFHFLSSRVGAFISEYLIDGHSARLRADGGRVALLLPIQEGVFRAFDPYAAAVDIVQRRGSLKEFLRALRSFGAAAESTPP